MCRLAIFPPNFKRNDAIEILKDFECGNTDGTGYTFIKNNQFYTQKWPKALSKILENRNEEFLNHMPHSDSWTIAHLRAASHGENYMRNTHPFIINDKWAFMHNGVWSEYFPVKEALSCFLPPMKGETDTEVAGELFNLLGPKRFYYALQDSNSGVFIGLNLNGKIWIAKTSGDLEKKYVNGKIVMASSFPNQVYSKYVKNGWYKLNKEGEIIDKEVDEKDRDFSYLRRYQFKPSKQKQKELYHSSYFHPSQAKNVLMTPEEFREFTHLISKD